MSEVMRMRGWLLSVLAALFLSLGVAACDDDSSGGGGEQTEQSSSG
ncbi:MAG: hypothetical protein R3F55_07355 [Alphaproteobacteria bacterium]